MGVKSEQKKKLASDSAAELRSIIPRDPTKRSIVVVYGPSRGDMTTLTVLMSVINEESPPRVVTHNLTRRIAHLLGEKLVADRLKVGGGNFDKGAHILERMWRELYDRADEYPLGRVWLLLEARAADSGSGFVYF